MSRKFEKKLKKFVNERIYKWQLVDINPDTGIRTIIFRIVDNRQSMFDYDPEKCCYHHLDIYNKHWYFKSIHEYLDVVYRGNDNDSFHAFKASRKLSKLNKNLILEIQTRVCKYINNNNMIRKLDYTKHENSHKFGEYYTNYIIIEYNGKIYTRLIFYFGEDEEGHISELSLWYLVDELVDSNEYIILEEKYKLMLLNEKRNEKINSL